ncbi:MAG: acyl-CoA thioesterase [Pseudomonadota bacterium]
MTLPALVPLGPEALRAAGIPAPWAFGISDQVRFYELDALNHVNNTAYLRWFETTRLKYLGVYDISHYRPEDPTLVLRSVTAEYLAPMFLNERYVVTARTRAFRTTSFTMDYAVFVESQCRATGSAVIVTLWEDGSKRPLTDAAKASFRDRDGAEHAA